MTTLGGKQFNVKVPAGVQPQAKLRLKSQANFRERYLKPALEAGLIEMTIPDKPRSSRQKYRLTEKGRTLLAGLAQGGQ